MYRKQIRENSKVTECYEDHNEHHFTKSFEMDRVCQCGLESLDIKFQIEESEKRLTQLINNKNDKLIETIEALTKKLERLTAQPQSELSIKHEDVSTAETYEFQTLQQSTQDNSNTHPSEIMPLPSIEDVEFQQSTSNICIEEQYSLLGEPQQILNRLKNCFLKMDLRFTQCKKLYDFPDMKGVDFHKKIDNKNDLLFLAQLENNEIIGGFTHRCFDPMPNYIPKENKKSFLCNLNRDIFAFASRANKTLTYDENYFILGNWEIKVKNGENILETTWGSKSDCFQYTTFGGLEKHTMKQVKLIWQKLRWKRTKNEQICLLFIFLIIYFIFAVKQLINHMVTITPCFLSQSMAFLVFLSLILLLERLMILRKGILALLLRRMLIDSSPS